MKRKFVSRFLSPDYKGMGALLEEYDRKGDDMDAFEGDHLNGLLQSNGLPPIYGRDNLVEIGKGVTIHPNSSVSDKAIFNIRVQRLTANIAAPLEIAIFGTTHAQSGYIGRINPAAGGSFVVAGGLNSAVAATVDRMRFTHTVGAGVDIIDVTCLEVPYPTFLNAQGTDLFVISNIRYTLDDATQTSQFAQALEQRQKSLFGKADQNPIPVLAFKKPEQFQAGIIDVPCNIPIDKESFLALSVVNLVTSFTLSMFVSRFRKHDSQELPKHPRSNRHR